MALGWLQTLRGRCSPQPLKHEVKTLLPRKPATHYPHTLSHVWFLSRRLQTVGKDKAKLPTTPAGQPCQEKPLHTPLRQGHPRGLSTYLCNHLRDHVNWASRATSAQDWRPEAAWQSRHERSASTRVQPSFSATSMDQ